jgi:protein involved in polysaccharide export with SLBB domain
MNHPIRSLIALVTLVVIPLLPAHGQEAAPQSLRPGDQIRISVWRDTAYSGEFAVAANGTILHPLYREIQVAGLSMPAVEDRIRTFLLKYQTNPQFVVQGLVRIVVGGEVRSPNVYTVPLETTVTQAIAIAGGLTERGNLRKVKLARDRQETALDLTQPTSEAGLIQIRSGDQVLVGRASIPFVTYIAPVASTIAALTAILSLALR